MSMSALERFEAKYIPVPESGCWLWTGATWSGGRYGSFWVDKDFNNGTMTNAHRASIYLYKGIHPKDGVVCHRCDVTLCVNPDHLFLGSLQDNMADMVSKGRLVMPHQKADEQTVEMAKRLRAEGMMVKDIACIIGLSSSQTSRIIRGSRTYFNKDQ